MLSATHPGNEASVKLPKDRGAGFRGFRELLGQWVWRCWVGDCGERDPFLYILPRAPL